MRTFTFTKVDTGGKLEVEGKSEKEVREARGLDPDLWTLDGPGNDEKPSETTPSDDEPP